MTKTDLATTTSGWLYFDRGLCMIGFASMLPLDAFTCGRPWIVNVAARPAPEPPR